MGQLRPHDRAETNFVPHLDSRRPDAHAEVNFVTALVPSETACLESSPPRERRTAVWISRDVSVWPLPTLTSLPASVAIRSNASSTIESMTFIAFDEIVNDGWTCFSTR